MNAVIDITNIQIETERLILRAWQMNDLEPFYIHAFDDEEEMNASVERPPIAVFQGILNKIITEAKTFAIVLKENGMIIGSLGLQPRHADTGLPDELNGREISYELFKDYRGKGYMTEAVNAVCRYCFDRLHYDYLSCGYFDGNTKSKGVIERCGFTWLKDIDTVVAQGKSVPGKLYIRYQTNK